MLQIDLGAKLLVFEAQTFELIGVADGDRGQSRDSREELKVILAEGRRRIAGVQINDAEEFIGGHKRNAEQGMGAFLPGSVRRVKSGTRLNLIVEDGNALIQDVVDQRAVYVDRMFGAGDAIPSNSGGRLGGAVVEEENRAAFGGNHVENHAEQLPLERFGVAHRTDDSADLEKSDERAVEPFGVRQCGKRFRAKIKQFIMTELMSLCADCKIVIEVDGTAGSERRVLGLKKEERTSYADLITRRKNALLYGNAIHKSTRGAVQVR
jgi:hypothetical protein